MDSQASGSPGCGDLRGDRSLKIQLAVETSLRPGSVALLAGERSTSRLLQADRSHASDLLPAIESMREELKVHSRRDALDVVYVGTGPGSYTGLRVGIACAQGLARASGARLVGLPSFEWMAFSSLRPGETGSVLCDARAGAFSFATYVRGEEDVTVATAPKIVRYEALSSALSADVVLLADERGSKDALDIGHKGELRPIPQADADALLRLGKQRLKLTPDTPLELVEPLYLRSFGQ